jgi:pyruvate,orthophosphate dikinase
MPFVCREEALAELKTFQRADFEGIFEAMDGLPVTIRLLDPPLHEFLPKGGEALDALCAQLMQSYRAAPGQRERRRRRRRAAGCPP